MPPNRSLAVVALLLTMLSWGSAAVFMRTLALALTPENAIALRYVITTAVSVAGLLLLGTWRIARADWPRFIVAGVAGMAGYNWFVTQGFALVPAGVGAVITSVEPLMIAFLSWLILKEALTPYVFLGLIVALCGAVALFWHDIMGVATISMPGAASLVICAAAWSVYTVAVKPLSARYDSFTITAVTMIIAAPLLILPATEPIVSLAMRLDARQWAEMMFLVIPNGILGTMLWTYGAARLPGAAAGAFLYLIPVIAIFMGWFVLSEVITVNVVAGAALAIAGVALAQFGPALSNGKDGQMTRFAAVGAVMFAVTMWGLVPVATRYLLDGLSPQTVLVLRLVPAGFLAAIVAIFLCVRPIAWSDWSRILIASILGNVGYQALAHFGMKTVPAVWTGMLFGLEPVFIALFAVILLRDRLTPALAAGMLIAFAGTGVLVFGSASGAARDVGLGGLILVTLSTMGWGIYTVVLRPVAKRYGSFETSCLTLAISAFPMLLFLTPGLPGELAGMGPAQIAVAAFMVCLATFGAVAAWNYGAGHMPSALAGMFLYVQPLVAAAGGTLLLEEQLTWPLIAGGAMILAGVAVAQMPVRLSSPQAAHVPQRKR